MITQIQGAAPNVAAFEATGEVEKNDFDNVIFPRVKDVVDQYGELNYLLLINTDLGNFTAGAWLQDAYLGIQNLTKWNRGAIVTDNKSISDFTDMFSKVVPGTFRGFSKAELQDALDWVAGK